MMDYNDFKELVQNTIRDYLPDDGKNRELQFSTTEKPNCTLDAMSLITEGVAVAPTLYINSMYEAYQRGQDIDGIITDVVSALVKEADNGKLVLGNIKLDYEQHKDKIVLQIVNYEQNKEWLNTMPHRTYLDLAVIYRSVLKIDKETYGSMYVTNDIASQFGKSEEELFDLAIDNTKRLFTPTVMSLNDMISDMIGGLGFSDEEKEELIDQGGVSRQYVIGNKEGMYGATAMLYEDVLHELADQIGQDLYILPSSLHEVIAMPALDEVDPEFLANMVRDINEAQVRLEERLSNQVYHYDRNKRELTLATDTPYKRLDGGECKEEAMEMPNITPKRRGR